MSKKTSNFSFEKEVTESTEEKENKDVIEEVNSEEDYNDADKFMYDYDSAVDNKSSNNLEEQKKKLFKLMGIIMGVSLLIVIIIFIISLFTSSKYAFEDIEVIMTEAATNYFDDNQKDLPVDETEISIIDVDSLVIGEYMKPLDDYLPNGVVCTGEVKVSKVEEKFYYKPFLDCGEDYLSLTLSEKIIESSSVTTGYGLFKENDIYYYQGEISNNYMKFGDYLWRIVRINNDNTITLVLDDYFEYSGVWDNRYNSILNNNNGINDYSISRSKEYNDTIFENINAGVEDALLYKEDVSKIVPVDLCIGKRDINAVGSDNSIECSTTLDNQYIGMLTVSDFIAASADSSCLKASDKACQNYNYLVTKFSYWLITADSNSTDQVYLIDRDEIELEQSSNYNNYRPVITLNKDVMYKSGDGTINDAYIIR